MKITDVEIMKLFVLYFNHNPKIVENIDFYDSKGTSRVKKFYFKSIDTFFGIDWFILNMETGEGIIMTDNHCVLSNITSIKQLIRFIRIFRNTFIGSPYHLNETIAEWDCDEIEEEY